MIVKTLLTTSMSFGPFFARVVAAAILSLLINCGGGGAPAPDAQAPKLQSTSPAKGGSGVGPEASIELIFDEPVAANSVVFGLSGPNGPVQGTLTVLGSLIRFVPQRPLAIARTYQVTLDSSLSDPSGNRLSQALTYSFTTALRNAGLKRGFHAVDSFMHRTWGGSWNPFPTLFTAGFDWIRVGVTTKSIPDLRSTPPADWGNIPFRDEFWSSREVAGQILKEASSLGARLHVFLFLSDTAAFFGQQNSPPEWRNLTVQETAARVEENAFDTAAYFTSLGLNVEVYEIGNETDIGILNFTPGDRVALPPGTDLVNDMNYMKTSVWNIEAELLSAVIRGVRRANSNAKIALHIAGLGFSRNNVFPKTFFEYMAQQGVAYDIAGFSFPYMVGGGQAVPQPYFRNQDFLDTISHVKALGKEVYISEFSYPAFPNGTTKTPAAEYPFTPSGQEAWLRDFIAVVQARIDGLFYFYPDYYPGSLGPEDLQHSGLFESNSQALPALNVISDFAQGR